ncbi:MAG: LysR substrate-binding domain-containing protein [Pseudomonadota bacterium]
MRDTHAKPPMRSLEVFAAAARLEGFTAAGHALGITQSAVSRQVSDLEAQLGVALFRRRGAHVTATPAGRRLAQQLTAAFGDIRKAVADAAASDRVVTLSMLPSVAAKWLAPRLGRFVSVHPEIDLRVTASRHLVSFADEGVDAAIRYGQGAWPGLVADKLADETITPVCTPAYAHALGLADPADLARAVLLHGDIPEDWAAWFKAAGASLDLPAGPRLGDDTAILQAVLDDNGVALGRSRLVAEDVAAGRLIQPFSTHLTASYAYWFVRPEGHADSAALAAVEAWVKAEFRGATGQTAP